MAQPRKIGEPKPVFKTSDASRKLSSWAHDYGVKIKNIQTGKGLKDKLGIASWDTHVLEDDLNFDVYNDYGI